MLMPRSGRRHIDGAALALAIHVSICCTVLACLAFAFYAMMQPTRINNLGLAAYEPPPGTVINFASPARLAQAPDRMPASIEPAAEPIDASAPQQKVVAKKPIREAKTERPKRQRAARRKERRNPMMDYAFQPFFGGYRPWY